MSRYVINIGNREEFVYGWDHALGYFYEIWDYKRGKEDEECIVKDKSYLFNKLTKSEMSEVMQKNNANPLHINLLLKDLPF